MKNENALIVIAKYPDKGKVKTRISGLTDEQRVQLYEHLLRSTMDKLSSLDGVDTWIAFAPTDAEDYFRQFNTGLLPLSAGGLGERMHHAFTMLFSEGYSKVSLVGADIPDLQAEYIHDSFDVLEDHDLVFGPASDGGYYLVGMRKLVREIFTDVPWSSSETLEKSIRQAQNAACSYDLIKTLSDVDTMDDLKRAGILERVT